MERITDDETEAKTDYGLEPVIVEPIEQPIPMMITKLPDKEAVNKILENFIEYRLCVVRKDGEETEIVKRMSSNSSKMYRKAIAIAKAKSLKTGIRHTVTKMAFAK